MSNRKRVTLTFEIDDHDGFNDEAFMRNDFLGELSCCVNNPYEDTFVMKVEDADAPHDMSAREYFKEKARMKATLLEECKKRVQCREPSCCRCQWSYRDRVPNSNFEREFPNESIATVEKWAREHEERSEKDE